MLGVWSETLWKQFQETPGLEYLGESCKALSEAIRHTPHGNLFLVDRLGKLAIRLHLYYLRTWELDKLGQAIGVSQKALKTASHDYDEAAMANLLEEHAYELQSRSEERGTIQDLAEAIELTEKAIAKAPSDRSKVGYLNNLGNRLEKRFDLINRVEDLREAILNIRYILTLSI
jgi:tetratricopeptide (TPR) repeat protein